MHTVLLVCVTIFICTFTADAKILYPLLDGSCQQYRVIYVNGSDGDVPSGMAIYRAADAGLIDLRGTASCGHGINAELDGTLSKAKTCLRRLPSVDSHAFSSL